MPAAIEYITELNSSAFNVLEEAYNKERNQRHSRIETNWSAYQGIMKAPLQPDGSTPGLDDNVVLPLLGTLIDKGNAAMQGIDDTGIIDGISMEVVNDDGAIEENAQLMLDTVWDANRRNYFLQNMFLSSSVSGHGYVQMIPDGKENPFGGPDLIRLVNLNPTTVNTFWNESDAEEILWHRIQIGAEHARRIDYVRAGNEWHIYEYSRPQMSSQWIPAEDNPQVWPFAWSPIIDYQNLPTPGLGGYYGRDDVGVLLGINHALNFAVSNMQRIIKRHAHPKTVVTGGEIQRSYDEDGNEVVEDDPGRLLEFISPETKVFNVEMQSDGAAAFSQVQFLLRQFFNNGRQVDPATVADKLGDITNFGLRVMYNDTLARRQEKWLTASEALEAICQHILELSGFGVGHTINIIPPDPLPADPAEQTTALQTDVQVFGLSPDTALEKRGYDPDAEAEARQRTRTEKVADASSVAVSGSLARLQADGRGIRTRQNGGSTDE